MNSQQIIKLFTRSAAVILLITAIAKLISFSGSAKILDQTDPILVFSFRHIFLAVGLLEVVIATLCFLPLNKFLQVSLLAWLSTIFLTYRLSLYYLNYHRPCSCLGNLTDALGVPPFLAEFFLKCVVVYLLLGSYTSLAWLYAKNQRRRFQLDPNLSEIH